MGSHATYTQPEAQSHLSYWLVSCTGWRQDLITRDWLWLLLLLCLVGVVAGILRLLWLIHVLTPSIDLDMLKPDLEYTMPSLQFENMSSFFGIKQFGCLCVLCFSLCTCVCMSLVMISWDLVWTCKTLVLSRLGHWRVSEISAAGLCKISILWTAVYLHLLVISSCDNQSYTTACLLLVWNQTVVIVCWRLSGVFCLCRRRWRKAVMALWFMPWYLWDTSWLGYRALNHVFRYVLFFSCIPFSCLRSLWAIQFQHHPRQIVLARIFSALFWHQTHWLRHVCMCWVFCLLVENNSLSPRSNAAVNWVSTSLRLCSQRWVTTAWGHLELYL